MRIHHAGNDNMPAKVNDRVSMAWQFPAFADFFDNAITRMLPVATPPNAIVYGSNKFTIATMMKAGFALNVIGIFVVTIFAYYFAPLIF